VRRHANTSSLPNRPRRFHAARLQQRRDAAYAAAAQAAYATPGAYRRDKTRATRYARAQPALAVAAPAPAEAKEV